MIINKNAHYRIWTKEISVPTHTTILPTKDCKIVGFETWVKIVILMIGRSVDGMTFYEGGKDAFSDAY